MNKTAKYLSLTACALAASLFLSGCGGGADAETAAPTVTISATESGSKVLFTFVFSDDVGTTFTADDVAVVGGAKASSVTRIDATHYTLDVTPDSSAANVTATVASGKFSAVARTANALASSAALPSSAAPVPPTRATGDVVSIYSDAYTPADANVGMFEQWGQSTTMSDLSFAGNNVKKYSNLNYQGIQFSTVDVSGMSKLHIDVWTPDLAAIKVFLISSTGESPVTLTPTKNGWNSFDIDLAQYTVNKATVFQMKLDVQPARGTLYVDNIYFYKGATTTPTSTSKVLTFSESKIGFGVFDNNGGGTVDAITDPTDSSNKVVRLVKKAGDTLYFGTKFFDNTTTLTSPVLLAAGSQTITLRVKSPAVGLPLLVKLEGGAGGAQTEKQLLTTVANAWETLSFVMPATGTFSTLVLMPSFNATVNADTTFYVDDISYPPGASESVSTATEMGAGGAQTLTIASGDVKTGDSGNTMFVANEGIFAVNYVGSAEANPPYNLAGWTNAKTASFTGLTGVSGGNIGYYQDDVNLSDSPQKAEESGWVSGTALAPLGVPGFHRAFRLRAAVSTSAYMGLYVNAPKNGTVDTSNFSKIKFKVWGPAGMFERDNFNPRLEVTLAGPKVTGCATGSGGTEITQTFTANLKNGAGGAYTLPFSSFTVKGLCGTDTNANAVANVRANLARVVVNVPGTSFNFTNADNDGIFSTGINLGPIGFTNN